MAVVQFGRISSQFSLLASETSSVTSGVRRSGRSLFVHGSLIPFASRTATVAAVTIIVAAVFAVVVVIDIARVRTRETSVIMKSV